VYDVHGIRKLRDSAVRGGEVTGREDKPCQSLRSGLEEREETPNVYSNSRSEEKAYRETAAIYYSCKES